jgi:hypothetical protein
MPPPAAPTAAPRQAPLRAAKTPLERAVQAAKEQAEKEKAAAAAPAPKPSAPAVPRDPNEPPLGDALNRRRERMGVSREALAAFSKLSWGFITEVESGRRRDPASRTRLNSVLDAWQKRLNDERKQAS